MESIRILNSGEFVLIRRQFKAGEYNRSTIMRNGSLVTVPTDPIEKEAFFIRYPPVCPSVKEDSIVMIHKQAQLMQYGKFVFICDDDDWQSEEVLENATGTAFHELYHNHHTSAMKFLEDSQFTCCVPVSLIYFWERAFTILQVGEEKTFKHKPYMDNRLIIVDGSVLNGDEIINAPNVLTIENNLTLKAIDKRAQIVEFWKVKE